jgi:hypothetical protein
MTPRLSSAATGQAPMRGLGGPGLGVRGLGFFGIVQTGECGCCQNSRKDTGKRLRMDFLFSDISRNYRKIFDWNNEFW